MFDENDPWHHLIGTIQKHYRIGPYRYYRDIEQEIMEALAQEITAEIDNEIIETIMKAAKKTIT